MTYSEFLEFLTDWYAYLWSIKWWIFGAASVPGVIHGVWKGLEVREKEGRDI